MYILTADLYGDDVQETDLWVEMDKLSNRTETRISPFGENTLGIGQDELKGMSITEVEAMLKKIGYILCKVGLEKIYFSKI